MRITEPAMLVPRMSAGKNMISRLRKGSSKSPT